ncbi:MAG: glycosaminoglycan attachment site [Proteobacteria bacterium]|nr:glycosaminoglycan attachment site [Pseudomonadota bacterium]
MSQVRARLIKRKIKNVKARRDVKRARSRRPVKRHHDININEQVSSLDLFTPVAESSKQDPIFKMMLEDKYAPEREVLKEWATGFEDRDGKFVYEFQTTFESSMWELYIHQILKEQGGFVDFSHSAPDFLATLDDEISIEATISAPAVNTPPPVGHSSDDIPDDLGVFNQEAALRLCNSFSSKFLKYEKSYSKMDHVADKPFVIAIASFDRPFSHLSAHRPIMAALYGIYFDEEATIESGAENVVSYPVDGVVKNEKTTIPLGYFATEKYRDVSAVIYSSLATWGKIRALADNKDARSVYTTFHPSEDSLHPEVRVSKKSDYKESIFDGLYIFHNPYAKNPLSINAFGNERVAQLYPDENGDMEFIAPDDFLLLRFLKTVNLVDAKEVAEQVGED